ncbi:MAG: hypothetical protein Q9195_008253 [Heterodermia aff. obscurata]
MADATHPRTVRGAQASITYDEDALLIKYNDGIEIIEDRCIIATTGRISSRDSRERSILIVKTDETSESGSSLEAIEATGLPPAFEEWHAIDLLPLHLRPTPSEERIDLHVIISTRSGTGLGHAFFQDVVRPCLAAFGLDNAYETHRTTSERTITELAESIFLPRAKSGVRQTIIVLAGDGAVVDLVNVFQSWHLNNEDGASFVKPAIALIPMGTGNALANSAGINSDATHGLRHLLRGSPQEIPTFKAMFSPGSELLVHDARKVELLAKDGESEHGVIYGAVVCSWGLHASLVGDSDTAEYRKHGSDRFSMAAKELLSPSDGSASHAYKGKVTLILDGGNERQGFSDALPGQQHMYILATMVSNLEQNFRISPHTRPLDGQMRLLYFGPLPGERVMNIMGRAFTDGTHIKDEAVTYRPIDGIRIDFDEDEAHWRRVCVDGKIIRVDRDGWVEVSMGEQSLLDLIVVK